MTLLYRLLMSGLAAKELTARALTRDWAAIRDRLGNTHPAKATPHLWIHAASNGELASAKPVITQLLAQNRAVFLTVNTDSARAMAHSWGVPNLSVQLAPVDLPGPTRSTLSRWQVKAQITFESDLWPNRILLCPGPVIVLGGRLTERSARGWAKLGALPRKVLARVTYLSAQDSGSLERFQSFELSPSATGPVFDLKALYAPPDTQPDAALRAAFTRSDTWLAASTHEGEDATILAAHKMALATRPDLKLILAPRHPRRGDDIQKLIEQTGLTFARRSQGDAPGSAQIYLADTLGEMHLWYALAGVTFVAGSLTDRGGHTPYEPAAFGSAILHGPDTANFRPAYNRLHDAKATICTATSQDLSDALLRLAPPEAQMEMGRAAQAALRQETQFDALMRDVVTVLDA